MNALVNQWNTFLPHCSRELQLQFAFSSPFCFPHFIYFRPLYLFSSSSICSFIFLIRKILKSLLLFLHNLILILFIPRLPDVFFPPLFPVLCSPPALRCLRAFREWQWKHKQQLVSQRTSPPPMAHRIPHVHSCIKRDLQFYSTPKLRQMQYGPGR